MTGPIVYVGRIEAGRDALALTPVQLGTSTEPELPDEFFEDLARTLDALEAEERRVQTDGARTPFEWGMLIASPARGEHRSLSLLRIAGKLLRLGLDPYPLYTLMIVWNHSRCRPPLPLHEVEALHRWLIRRHRDAAQERSA